MFRIDAQHSFAPPQQGPEWYGKILTRNKFSASIYTLAPGASIPEALELAARYPYIGRVVPSIAPEALAEVPDHPLITSVHLIHPTPAALIELERRRLTAEIDAQHWPVAAAIPLAVRGIPDSAELPSSVYVKLTGFRLPATPDQKRKLEKMLYNPGPERLLFASGWPHAGSTWKETLAAFTQCLGPRTIELREQVLGLTAREFYRL